MVDKKLSDKEKIVEIIDGLVSSIKQAARQVFDVMVETTAKTTSEMLDKNVYKIKEKITKEEANDNDEEDSNK